MPNVLKIVSLLLSYPTADLLAAAPELHDAIRSDLLTGPREKVWLDALVDDECLECDTCHLSADRVEARDNDHTWLLVE